MSNEKHYDAFLSLNSEDLAAVEAIARWLEDKAQLKIWLYTWNMIPGEPLQESMEKALDHSQCCVVKIFPKLSNFFGASS
ncbi:toll/interleukin-1 receptor domain-containing protein [candidate division KSB1 bacterium]|nr:toll/interleukin-1 receptor domain-containing protein [candidate division KSB1 bacterium]